MPVLVTKLYIPPSRASVVLRSRLIALLNEGLHRKLTLISAPAGFGKTTLVSEWLASGNRPAAWLSLDEGDNDPTRFLIYLIAALQTTTVNLGEGVLMMLQSPQPPPIETLLTALLNEIVTLPSAFVLVLDDYHVLDAKPIDDALVFLLDHLPSRMHLVIITREDPDLHIARLRAKGQLSELRAADLRFTPAEAAGFLNEVMRLDLTAEDIAVLETRTEGWIVGLQLAALSLQGHQDTRRFIQSFRGSHHFVLDYLLEEVLHQQSASVQKFLLQTSILDRLCGSLCDAVLLTPSGFGQDRLEYLEHANLFLVPLDNERRWYRYHHLFADLLRQRLTQSVATSTGTVESAVYDLHSRASQWYEDHELELEAFHHAAAANDLERIEHLIEGRGMPLQFRGAGAPVLQWLESLPRTVLDSRPSLWVTYASTLLFGRQHSTVELKLQAAEAALQNTELDESTRDLVGRIASMRATLGILHHNTETIIAQSRRALEYLHPANLLLRSATTYTLGYAYQAQGDRAAASQAFIDVIATAGSLGASIYTLAATLSLGQVQEADNQLALATATYQQMLQLAGDPLEAMACEAYLGLARICYQWNDLEAAQQYGQQCLQLAKQMDSVDTSIGCWVLLGRMRLAQADAAGAADVVAQAETFARQHHFDHKMPEIAAAQVLILLHQGNLMAAAHLAQMHALPLSQARVHLAQGDPSAALALLEPLRRQMELKGWRDEQLKVMVLQVLAHQAHGDTDKALQVLGDMLPLAALGSFIRLFVDEGLPMAELLSQAAAQSITPEYTRKLLAAFEAGQPNRLDTARQPVLAAAQPLIDPLSDRELEVLQLIAQGLSNREISDQLFLALSTVKGHTQKIFDKLHVQRRTEAVARARELRLL